MKKSCPFHQSGQSLVEMLVMTGILMLLLVSLMSIMVTAVAKNRIAKEQAIADRLAQEGMEWMRYHHESMLWDELVTYVNSNPVVCLTDFTQNISNTGACVTSNPDYKVSGNYQADFYRTIYINYDNIKDFFEVKVVMEWLGTGGDYREQSIASEFYNVR